MKKMKMVCVAVVVVSGLFAGQQAQAQIPVVSLITGAIKKVIVAIDLKVQQLQNKTIILQNAEAELENKMSLGNLNDISGWLNREKDLYDKYYKELAQVKQVISGYEEVKEATKRQMQLVNEYKTAYALFRQDKNFNPAEISYMGTVYNGILQQSIRNLDEIVNTVTSLTTQMSDGERLAIIHRASAGLQKNLDDLRQFNNGNISIALQRARETNNINEVKKLYGLSN